MLEESLDSFIDNFRFFMPNAKKKRNYDCITETHTHFNPKQNLASLKKEALIQLIFETNRKHIAKRYRSAYFKCLQTQSLEDLRKEAIKLLSGALE